MGEEGVRKKGTYGVAAKVAAMSPEEKKIWYAKRAQKIAYARSAKLAEISEWKAQTLTQLTNDLKQLRLDFRDPSTPIAEAALWTVHGLLKRGFSIVELRDKMIADGVHNEESWGRFKKALFGEHIAKIEDIGLDVFTSQNFVREQLQAEFKHLKQVQKRRPDDVNVSEKKMQCLMRMHEVQISLMKNLVAAGEIGQKGKKGSTAIHFHSSVPRPVPIQDSPIDVTPKKPNGSA